MTYSAPNFYPAPNFHSARNFSTQRETSPLSAKLLLSATLRYSAPAGQTHAINANPYGIQLINMKLQFVHRGGQGGQTEKLSPSI